MCGRLESVGLFETLASVGIGEDEDRHVRHVEHETALEESTLPLPVTTI